MLWNLRTKTRRALKNALRRKDQPSPQLNIVVHTEPRPAKRLRPTTRPERFLFIAFYDPRGISTVSDNVEVWCGTSRFNVDFINLFEGNYPGGLELPPNLDLSSYNGIIIHCTVSYNAFNLQTLDKNLKTKLADYDGLKIIMKQDEHFKTNQVADYIGSRGFHFLITITVPREVRAFYPESAVKDVKFIHALTGYISPEMINLSYPKTDFREVDVGYRGSIQPLSFGRLAYEKKNIGDSFVHICKAHRLSYDISSKWEDRFAGKSWFDFLGRIKAVLGVESGASIVDFDGDIDLKVKEFEKAYPKASFEKLSKKVLEPYENNAYYKMISPRHLEAAATKTVQIMYPGDYSEIFHPERHFLQLNRDLSNAKEVIEKLRDPKIRFELTETAFEEIVMNKKFHYETFVSEIDNQAEDWFDSN